MSARLSRYNKAILCILYYLKAERPTVGTIDAQLTFQMRHDPDHPNNPPVKFRNKVMGLLDGFSVAEVLSTGNRLEKALSQLVSSQLVTSNQPTPEELRADPMIEANAFYLLTPAGRELAARLTLGKPPQFLEARTP